MKFFSLFFGFLEDVYQNKFLIKQLVMRDFKNKYIGSVLGFLWTIIQPFVMIFIFWLVFTKGFESGPVKNIPFIAWITCGIIVWELFVGAWTTATNVFQEYIYLVKQINFRVAILPLVKIFSALLSHGILLVICFGILVLNDVEFSWFWFQLLYYLFALLVLLLGVSWISSSLQVFLKDTNQIIAVVVQFGFWLTPIVWDGSIIPEKWVFLLNLNPVYYIVNGYRNSLLYDVPFWENTTALFWFWGMTGTIGIVGVFLFRKLRPQFADVL